MGTAPTRYDDWSIVQLLSVLWDQYGKSVDFDGKGRLVLRPRDYPSVPPEFHLALNKRHAEIRAIQALEKQSLCGLVAGAEVGDALPEA